MLVDKFAVESDQVQVTDDSIVSTYQYQATTVQRGSDGQWVVKPTATEYQFKTDRRVPKLGCVCCCCWHADPRARCVAVVATAIPYNV